MSWIEAPEKGIIVVVSAPELAVLFTKAAEVHEAKAKFYRAEAAKQNTESIAPEIEEELEAASYATKAANDIASAKKNYTDQARNHETQAKNKRFIATHLPLRDQELPPEALTKWGLVL